MKKKTNQGTTETWSVIEINGKKIDCLTFTKSDGTLFTEYGIKPMIQTGRLCCSSDGRWNAIFNYEEVATDISIAHKLPHIDKWEEGTLKYHMYRIEGLAYGFDQVIDLAETLTAKFQGKGDGQFNGDSVKIVEEIAANRKAKCKFLVDAIEAAAPTAVKEVCSALNALWAVKHRDRQNEEVISAIGRAANQQKRIPFKREARELFNGWHLWRGGVDSPARWNQILKTVGFDWLPAAKGGRKRL